MSWTFTSFAANNFAAERDGHLDGAETSAIDSGCWRAEELGELKRNARVIGKDLTNSISGGGYGTSSLEGLALAGAAAQLLGIGTEREWWDSDSDLDSRIS